MLQATTRSVERAFEPTTTPGDGGRLLAQVMSINAIFSAGSGLLLIVASWGLDTWMGTPTWLLVAVGVGLLAFAASLVHLLARPELLRTGGVVVVVADLAWVLGTAALTTLAPDALTPAGTLALWTVTAVVAGLAVGQTNGLRRIGRGPVHGSRPTTLAASRTIDATVARVWDAVSDAGGYAMFADGIATTRVEGAPGDTMVRVCTDDRGDQWRETCTLWEERRRYRMTVDVATYPRRLRALLYAFEQTWDVEPVGDGTRVELRFDAAVKLGVIGRLAVAALARDNPAGRTLDAYARHLG